RRICSPCSMRRSGQGQRFVAPTANPVIGVEKLTKETTRDRVLNDSEIRRLWDACATQNAYVCAWFRLRLVTRSVGRELLQMPMAGYRSDDVLLDDSWRIREEPPTDTGSS